MKSLIKHKNFPIVLYVIAALAAFLLVFALALMAFFNTWFSAPISSYVAPDDKYYINDQYGVDDPYMTYNPGLEDILAGPILSDRDPMAGNTSAPVTIVEYADFQCQYCQKQEKLLKEIMDNYQNKVRVIWKDYPEADTASISYQAARAGRCASAQGAFWPYHDLLFENSSRLSSDIFSELAVSLDLDEREFGNCLAGNEVDAMINDNIEEANALDINGVPFYYINDQELLGEADYEDFDRLVKIELSKAENKE